MVETRERGQSENARASQRVVHDLGREKGRGRVTTRHGDESPACAHSFPRGSSVATDGGGITHDERGRSGGKCLAAVGWPVRVPAWTPSSPCGPLLSQAPLGKSRGGGSAWSLGGPPLGPSVDHGVGGDARVRDLVLGVLHAASTVCPVTTEHDSAMSCSEARRTVPMISSGWNRFVSMACLRSKKDPIFRSHSCSAPHAERKRAPLGAKGTARRMAFYARPEAVICTR